MHYIIVSSQGIDVRCCGQLPIIGKRQNVTANNDTTKSY